MAVRLVLKTWAILLGLLAVGCSGPKLEPGSRNLRRDMLAVQKEDSSQSPYDPRPLRTQQLAHPAQAEKTQSPAPASPSLEPGGLPVLMPQPQVSQTPTLPTTTIPTDLIKQTAVKPETVEKDVPQKPEDPLLAAFRCFRENRQADGFDRLQSLDPATRDVLGLILQLSAGLGDRSLSQMRPDELTAAADALDVAMHLLVARAPLVMETMCFCRTIERFGVYDPLPPDHAFQAGVAGRPGDLVQVYVELKNFSVKHNKDAEYPYETALASTLVLRDFQKSDPPRWVQDRPAHVERTRSPRHDCFLNCHFRIPPNLPAGRYTLWIHVKDVTGLEGGDLPPNRTVARSLDLYVRGDGELLRQP